MRTIQVQLKNNSRTPSATTPAPGRHTHSPVAARVGNHESETSATESETKKSNRKPSGNESETNRQTNRKPAKRESETKPRIRNPWKAIRKSQQNRVGNQQNPNRKPLARFGNQREVNWKLKRNSETEGCPGALSPQLPTPPPVPNFSTPKLREPK